MSHRVAQVGRLIELRLVDDATDVAQPFTAGHQVSGARP